MTWCFEAAAAMLKWTVGQRKGGNGKRSPGARSGGSGGGGGGGGGPCYSIRRAAARLHQAARRSGGGKENHDAMAEGAMSPRTRDSVYMRLDSIPAALRDLSNQLTPGAPTTPRARRSSVAKTPTSTGKRQRTRLRRPRSPRSPGPNDLEACGLAPLQPPAGAADAADSTMTTTTTTTTTAALAKREAPSPLRIEYSPCPLRATRSLLTLRRRLVDAFGPHPHPQPQSHPHHYPHQNQQQHQPLRSAQHHSVGTLYPSQRCHDNPLYFTLQNRSRVDCVLESSLSPDEIPSKVRRRLMAPDEADRAPLHHQATSTPLSPLARHLQSLCLGADAASDVADPQRFLGLFGGRAISLDAQTDDFKLLRKHSLRRTRAATAGEDGPPRKVQPVAAEDGCQAVPAPAPIPAPAGRRRTRKSAKRRSRSASGLRDAADGDASLRRLSTSDLDEGADEEEEEAFTLRRRGGFRRRARASARVREMKGRCGLTLPEGIPSPATPCAGSQPHPGPLGATHPAAAASLSGGRLPSFSTIRYGLEALDYHHLENQYCDKSPLMDSPAHASPHALHDLHEDPSQRLQEQVDVDWLRRGTSLAASAPACSRLGLTLPAGIPSPPSPGLEGVHPLGESPFRAPAPPFAAAVAPPEQSSDDQTGTTSSSSSDQTWNSHRVHFLKTPRLSQGHVLCQQTTYSAPPATAAALPRFPSASDSLEEPHGGAVEAFSDGDGAASPLALIEERSRSRRCLMFSSPGGSTRHKRAASRRFTPWRRPRETPHASCPSTPQRPLGGELDLAIYGNSGLITVHVICGRNLKKLGGTTCNAYVKVAFVPSSEERTFHRTAVHRESSAPWFDHKFSCEILSSDLEKRILVSVWHRDKEKRRSEFLGCMSFAVKHAVKKEISGSFRLLSQGAGRTQHAPAVAATPASASASATSTSVGSSCSSCSKAHSGATVRARRSGSSSAEEVFSVAESDATSTPARAMERRKNCPKKKVGRTTTASSSEDSSFLRHLELEPGDAPPGRGGGPAFSTKGGRTPFTTTRKLTRHGGGGFGFSVAWTQPPRVERVESGQSADRAGLRPGDYIIFVEKYNVVTMPEDEVLQLIRSCGNMLTLEVYRRGPPNGLVGSTGGVGTASAPGGAASMGATTSIPAPGPHASTLASAGALMAGSTPGVHGVHGVHGVATAPPPRSSTTCSATTTSLDLSKRRLHLPQVTFSSEVGSGVIV